MILSGKIAILVPPIVVAFVWPFTGTETVMVITHVGLISVSIITALKASAAKEEASAAKEESSQAKLAVNGHLSKLEVEQDKAKKEREVEFDKLLQVVKDASRAEGEKIARDASAILAAKVAEEVARDRAKYLSLSQVAAVVVKEDITPEKHPMTP